MSDTASLSLVDAARRLGVPVRDLRRAMRAGRLPTPAGLTATSVIPADWVSGAEAAKESQPGLFNRAAGQTVPPFARYRGTSAWRKYRIRVREYEAFRTGSPKAV